MRHNSDGTFKSSVDKFYSENDLRSWTEAAGQTGRPDTDTFWRKARTLAALSELRLEMGNRLNLRKRDKFAPLWVVDFPLLEWDDETGRYYAMHHLHLTKTGGYGLMETDPGK